MTSAPKAWKKIIEEIAFEAKKIPLWGNPPPFPWQSFIDLVKKQLHAPDFHVECKRIDWIAAGSWRDGLGTKPTILAIEAPVLSGPLFWAASSEQVKETSLALLTSSSSENARATPLPFLKGFYRYLALEVLDALSQSKAFPGLQFSLSDQETIPDESLFSIDIEISCKGTKSFGRILAPSQTLGTFREFFRVQGHPLQTKEKASNIDIMLSLSIGKTSLLQTSWKEISVGDLLLLDRCDYDLKKKQGSADLLLEGKTIINCSLDGHILELLEYPNHEEEAVRPDEEEPEDEEFSEDEEFEDEDEEEFDDEDLDEEETEVEEEEEKRNPSRKRKKIGRMKPWKLSTNLLL